MPSKSQLRDNGRRDIDNAISKAGGYHQVAARLVLVRQTRRKPAKYWDDFDNLKLELLEFLGSNTSMPTLMDLRRAKRADLIDAIERNGGIRTVAEELNLNLVGRSKPPGYWDVWDTVEKELRVFMDQNTDGNDAGLVFPSQAELRAAGRADLLEAARKHGGLKACAQKLGISSPKKKADLTLWAFPNMAKEIYVLTPLTNGRMPTIRVLRKLHRSDLINAIRRFGGMADVARRLNLPYRVTTRENFKDWIVFRNQLLSFTSAFGKYGIMPSARTLENFGRDDLRSAILHHGGDSKVADKLGLKREYLQDFHEVAIQLLEFIERHGTEGVMPTEGDLLEMGRSALNVAIAKFGFSQTAKRLGLKESGAVKQKSISAFVDSALYDEIEEKEKHYDKDDYDWVPQMGSDDLDLSVSDLGMADK